MAREIAEIPAAAERLRAQTDAIKLAATSIQEFAPRTMVFCGRGSSGQVGVYLRYLFEAKLGLLGLVFAGQRFRVRDHGAVQIWNAQLQIGHARQCVRLLPPA